MVVGYYDERLVALSVLRFCLPCWALTARSKVAGRVTAARGRARVYWLLGGATAMGIGTWSMHYTGMLASRLPISVAYDWPTALLSVVASFLASAVGLLVVSPWEMRFMRTLATSILMGGGISALHYTAMASMRLEAVCRYSSLLVTLSVVLAIMISLASLRTKNKFLRQQPAIQQSINKNKFTHNQQQ